MIRNIVFDLGRVLVGFDPLSYLRSFCYDEKTVQALMRNVYDSEDWTMHDRGDYATIEDMRDALIEKYPALEKELREILTPDWVEMHVLRADVAAYLLELKARGYRVYLLSNLAADSHAYVSRFDFFRALDGGVYSYQERCCKPDERIYDILLERYGLRSGETAFLDDNADNIAAAKRMGIHGIVFTDLAPAQQALEALLEASPDNHQ